jgi:ectoine hydroxylase-related dioxygenase (phytanoyl-CoA dioxygenase family)
MNESEKYLFDVHGFLLIENVLTAEELAAANAAVDAHAHEIQYKFTDLARGSSTLVGEKGRGDLLGMLTWDQPHCQVFRDMIAHPRLAPYLKELLGPGFRLAQIDAVVMDQGAEGFFFHEGGEPRDRSRAYHYHNGRMFCGLTNIAIQLTDVGPQDGGFACLPGSHKANYPCPDDIRLYQAHRERMVQPAAKAGDAILFVETLMHGSLPWVASHQRRTALVRFNTAVAAETLMGTYTPPSYYDELTEAQKSVLAAPAYQYEDKGSKLYQEDD